MRKTIFIYLITICLIGCSFKESSDEAANFGEVKGTLSVHILNSSTHTEDIFKIEVIQKSSGEYKLAAPVFLPTESSSLRFYLSSHDLGGVERVQMVDTDGVSAQSFVQLTGSYNDVLEYGFDPNAKETTFGQHLQIKTKSGIEVSGLVFPRPSEIKISRVDIADPTKREVERDLFLNSGSYFFVHSLRFQNLEDFAISLHMPSVVLGEFLVQRFQDQEVPNPAVRNVDPNNCGSATLKQRAFFDSSLEKAGLYLVPRDLARGEEVSQHLAQEKFVLNLESQEDVTFDVYVKERSELQVVDPIFTKDIFENKNLLINCVRKRRWIDTGRGEGDFRKYSSNQEDSILPKDGFWSEYGEPEFIATTFQSGVARVQLQILEGVASPIRVLPKGHELTERSMFDRSPEFLRAPVQIFSRDVQ